MRKFTILFLLVLAMTIGANQAFANGHTSSNDNGRTEQSRPDNDDDREDPSTTANRASFIPCSLTHGYRCDVPPPRKPKPAVVQVEPKDCGCVHKVMLVNGRFMPFIDCYQSILVNGREQLRYCRKDG